MSAMKPRARLRQKHYHQEILSVRTPPRRGHSVAEIPPNSYSDPTDNGTLAEGDGLGHHSVMLGWIAGRE